MRVTFLGYIFFDKIRREMQARLFETLVQDGDGGEMAAVFRDSAFGKNKDLPLHRWVPWVAGFSADFVEDCIEWYIPPTKSKENVWVLDPFAGVGTTLVESYRRGLNVIGFEINPYAALASRLKLQARRISTQKLASQIEAFERFMASNCPDGFPVSGQPQSRAPNGFNGRTELFNPVVEKRVLFALDFINALEDGRLRDLFKLALGSVIVSVSNYSYEPSLTRRASVGKAPIVDAPVTKVVVAKLRLMLADIDWMQKQVRRLDHLPEGKVIQDSIFSAKEVLGRTRFVDLVITSPPYLNNYHYPRNTRPQLHWLGFATQAGYGEGRETDSFGKFWQTVRGLPLIDLTFSLPELSEIIDRVRTLNVEKGAYGGTGWANYIATYFNDTYRFCGILKQLLDRGGVAVIVIGNSIIQGVEVKTDQLFGEIANLSGLKFEDNWLLRKKRTGSSIIQSSVRVDKATEKTVLYESAIVLRK